MISLNKVMIAGRLTRKPGIRKTPAGVSVTDLLVALNRDFINKIGEKQQEVCFVDVVVWGKLAEVCVSTLNISSNVLVEGRLELDTWFANQGKDKRCKLRIAAERIQFIDKKSHENDKLEEALNLCN